MKTTPDPQKYPYRKFLADSILNQSEDIWRQLLLSSLRFTTLVSAIMFSAPHHPRCQEYQ